VHPLAQRADHFVDHFVVADLLLDLRDRAAKLADPAADGLERLRQALGPSTMSAITAMTKISGAPMPNMLYGALGGSFYNGARGMNKPNTVGCTLPGIALGCDARAQESRSL
jgi:hypothetical protein